VKFRASVVVISIRFVTNLSADNFKIVLSGFITFIVLLQIEPTMMDVQGDTKSDSSAQKADSDKSNSARSQPQPYGQLWSERWPRRTLSSSSSITNQKSKTLSKVDRSQSYKLEKKDCMPSISRDRRKHSDPSIPTSITRASLDDEEYSSQDVTHKQLRSQGFRSVASSSLSFSTNLGFDVSQVTDSFSDLWIFK